MLKGPKVSIASWRNSIRQRLRMIPILGLLIVLLPFVGYAQEATNVVRATDTSPALRESGDDPLWTRKGCRNVTAAFFAGSLGAGAFFLGVLFGFISPESRGKVLEFLRSPQTTSVNGWSLSWFLAFGGVVAAIFQAAQASVFAPIQAFVLGATWPSVVTRIMTGNTSSVGVSSLVNAPPSQVPTPSTGGSAADAEVVIKPKTGK